MFVIGIGGGTGSGKTTVANKINEIIGKENCVILPMDNYYRDMSHIPFEERKKYNYDHPDMIEHTLMIKHLEDLIKGKSIELPEYDFSQYTRTGTFIKLESKPVIIVEGIFALYYEDLRKFYDLSIFVDAENDVRFIRRLDRDIKERGRTIDGVIEQYLNLVKPMHDAYVEPTKKYADLIIPRGGFNEKAINVVVEFIFKKMAKN
ncbi:MAG: uridine kinase [Thermosipho sp. (in: Bacteria)]|nr:uridine kinase [Thermosipho sp. (in: thermotogales)]